MDYESSIEYSRLHTIVSFNYTSASLHHSIRLGINGIMRFLVELQILMCTFRIPKKIWNSRILHKNGNSRTYLIFVMNLRQKTPSHYHSIMLSFHHSITLSLHHTITPSHYHSITPSLHHTITPSLHHSITLFTILIHFLIYSIILILILLCSIYHFYIQFMLEIIGSLYKILPTCFSV